MQKIRVNIVKQSAQAWINSWADKIANYADYDIKITFTVKEPMTSNVDLVHYIHYKSWQKTGEVPNITFFTHVEEMRPELVKKFLPIAQATDHCVVMCKRYGDYLIERLIPKDKITIVPLGLDRDMFVPKIKIGVCANLCHTPRKGEVLLQDLFKKADLQNFEFILAGRGWEKYMVDSRGKNIWDRVKCLGKLEQKELVSKFYHNIDYLLIPSSYEGGPVPCLEAMACGKEVISRPVGWVTEFKGVRLFNTLDDLIELLGKLDKSANDKRSQVTHMTWENWSKKNQELYRKVISNYQRI